MSNTRPTGMLTQEKAAVRDFWNAESCGERYVTGVDRKSQLDAQADERYRIEPYIHGIVQFEDGAGKDVLEIGVGMGADHLEWAKVGPRHLTGVDLTPRAVEFTRDRLRLHGYDSDVRVGDAEALEFSDNSFDLISSWGVLFCSPDTPRTIREVYRVLRPRGRAKIMFYHTRSLVGLMLWVRCALLRGKPFQSIRDVFMKNMESPGTKAYSIAETRAMFEAAGFSNVKITVHLSMGDLLEGDVGARHRGPMLTVAKAVYPRWFVRTFLRSLGGQLFIDATK